MYDIFILNDYFIEYFMELVVAELKEVYSSGYRGSWMKETR